MGRGIMPPLDGGDADGDLTNTLGGLSLEGEGIFVEITDKALKRDPCLADH